MIDVGEWITGRQSTNLVNNGGHPFTNR